MMNKLLMKNDQDWHAIQEKDKRLTKKDLNSMLTLQKKRKIGHFFLIRKMNSQLEKHGNENLPLHLTNVFWVPRRYRLTVVQGIM